MIPTRSPLSADVVRIPAVQTTGSADHPSGPTFCSNQCPCPAKQQPKRSSALSRGGQVSPLGRFYCSSELPLVIFVNPRKYDFENYLSSALIVNHQLRRTAFTLRAFNVELAQIRDLTTSDSTAQIRFQFWLDIVDEIYAKKTGKLAESIGGRYQDFPVAFELQRVHRSLDLRPFS